MAQDDPLATLLPKPPPPRPDRRETAIGEAMRRFDGTNEAPSSPGRRSDAKRTWWAAPWGRPQLGALLATAIVGLIVLPLWTSRERHPELASPAATSLEAERAGPVAAEPAPLPSAPQAVLPQVADGSDLSPATASPQADQPAVADRLAKSEALSMPAPSAPPAIVLAEPVAAPAPPPRPAAVAGRAAAESARERDDIGNDVIVTARRVESPSGLRAAEAPQRPRARKTSASGDWNACTVNDPAHSLATCSGAVSEGLARAWRDDLDGALAAFDRAIAASPQSGLAYLNRGLIHARKGEEDRALADLDRAVRLAPNSARTHYHRSLVLRRLGETARAEADAARAVELDPRYSAVIR